MQIRLYSKRIVLSLLVCMLGPHPRPGIAKTRGPIAQGSGETILLADNFDLNSIDASKWIVNDLFSGFSDSTVAVIDASQQLEIGPLKQSASGSHYNGLRSAATFNFSGAYSYVEVVTPPSNNTAADAMLTVGSDVNDFYRIYIESGNLMVQRKAAGAKAVLLSQPFNAVNDKYLRIRNDVATGSAIFEAAPDNSGVPGAWNTIYTETWNSSIPLTGIVFEIKAGTWQPEANPAGAVVFDNFKAAITGSSTAPSVTSISPASGGMAGGTPVSISGSGFSTRATVSFGGAAAAGVMVIGPGTIDAQTPAHVAGAVDVVVTNPDGTFGTLSSGFTYTSNSGVPPSDHVFIVMEENHGFSTVIGSAAMPYLNSLASTSGLAANYFANTHPSIGNYFMLTTGQIITNDDSFSGTVTADNIVRELIAAGKSWKVYAESLPAAGYTGGDQFPYLKHHNPMAYFSDVAGTPQAANIVPFTQFSSDLSGNLLPNFSFIVPNAQDDAHDCPAGMSTCADSDKLAAADSWLQANIAPLVGSQEFQKDGLLVIVFDESVSTDTANGGGQVAMLVVSPLGRPGYSSPTMFQHQSTLRMVCEALGLTTYPGAAASAPPMSEFFAGTTSETVLLADNFNQNTIDAGKWLTNSLFSGLTDSAVGVSDTSQQLQIGPLKQTASGSHYNGLRSAAAFDFTGAYCYVELVTPPASNTAADAMLTIGADVNNFYRMYVESGNLIIQRKAAGAKTVLLSQPYNAVNDKFLRIRHDPATSSAIFEAAPDGGGVPGAWSMLYSETWNTSVPLSGIIFELKAGTWQPEINAPGKVILDNFRAARP